PVLVRTDLVDRDMVVARVGELPDDVHVLLRIGAARDELRDVLLADVLRGLLEVSGERKLLSELAGDRDDRPPFVSRLAGLRFVASPAHLDLRDTRLADAPRRPELLDHLRLPRDADVAVADLAGELRCFLPGAGDVHPPR